MDLPIPRNVARHLTRQTARRATRSLAVGHALVFAIACVALGVRAQGASGSDVLTGAQVTEEQLLDALTPPIPGVQKRNLRVRPTGSPASMQGPTRPSASLLVTFRTSSSELTASAKQQLDVVGAALNNERLAPFRFTVEGHADPRGDPQSNLVLSQNRAATVRSYLVDSHGIDPARLIAEGKGDREVVNRAYPAAPENRRVTFVTNVH